jgi:hypothetical protein
MENLSVTLSARNLLLFTKYTGADPESNQIGRCGGWGEPDLACNFLESTDSWVLPHPRRFSISLRFGF